MNRSSRVNVTGGRTATQTPLFNVSPSNIAKQNIRADQFNTRAPITTVSSSPSHILASTTTPKTVSAKSPAKILLPIATTSRPTSNIKTIINNGKETSTVNNVRVYINSSPRRKLPQPAPKHTTLLLPTADDLEENVVERTKLLFPSKETLENFGFTSGHQNSFGIPIEEDERILRMLNYEMLNSQPKKPELNQRDDFLLISITTDANVHQTKVSPTLPNIKKNIATTERIRAVNVTIDDGNLHYIFIGFLAR